MCGFVVLKLCPVTHAQQTNEFCISVQGLCCAYEDGVAHLHPMGRIKREVVRQEAVGTPLYYCSPNTSSQPAGW